MSPIKEATQIDISNFFIVAFLIMSAFISMFTIISKFSEIIGRPFKWVREKKEDHELLIKTSQNLNALQHKHEEDVKQSIRHDRQIKDDLLMVSGKMDALSQQITDMQLKIDETETAKLKDSIVSYYRKYKDTGEWSKLESDAFWDIFKRYEAHGGNGFVHSVVEPIMREIKIVD